MPRAYLVRSRLALLGWLTVVAAMTAHAQQVQTPGPQPRDGAGQRRVPPESGTASISGVVTSASTGLPVRGARVSLTTFTAATVGPPMQRSALTDEQGRFSIAGLPAGPYRINVSKQGFLATSYGQRRHGLPGTTVRLGDGQAMSVNLQMPRGGVITGTVRDEYGEPAANAQVQAVRLATLNGERRFQQTSSASTDDRGAYRLHSLMPGAYVVCVRHANGEHLLTDAQRARQQVEGMRRVAASGQPPEAVRKQMLERAAQLEAQLPDRPEQALSYVPVCYPGKPAAGTSTIAVAAAEEQTGVDLQLQLAPAARVQGVVIFPDWGAARDETRPPVFVRLVEAGDALADGSNPVTPVRPDGRFEFTHVHPGTYRLTAATPQGSMGGFVGSSVLGTVSGSVHAGPGRSSSQPATASPPVWAVMDLVVDGRDVTDITLAMQRGKSVSGHVSFRGTGVPSPDLSRIEVRLGPVNVGPGMPLQLAAPVCAHVDAQGRFQLTDVMPGLYRLTASVPGGRWLLESATVGGEELLDGPFEVKPGRDLSGIEVSFTDRPATVAGTLVDARGEAAVDHTIVLFPEDERYRVPGSRRMRVTRPMPDGRFELRNVPPGDYYLLAALDEIEPGEWNNPEVLDALSASALRVTVRQGERTTRTVQVR
jgi:hypothetical protein